MPAPRRAVLLFGVDIVNADGVRSRTRRFRREQYLEPAQALERLLRNSSFVREPTAVVVRRSALESQGLFDPSVGGATDTDMWVRLFARYGVRCFPSTTCAYTIHEAAATTGMWNPEVIASLSEIFDRAVATGVVPEAHSAALAGRFPAPVHPGGRLPRLRVRRRTEAGQVLRLFDLPEIRALGASRKWWPVRAAFTAATAGANSSPAR